MPTACAVCTDKIGIAYPADSVPTVLFSAIPQIAAGESAKYGRTSGVGPFSLKAVEDLFDCITQNGNLISLFNAGRILTELFSISPVGNESQLQP